LSGGRGGSMKSKKHNVKKMLHIWTNGTMQCKRSLWNKYMEGEISTYIVKTNVAINYDNRCKGSSINATI
jgi:hypothetical protein